MTTLIMVIFSADFAISWFYSAHLLISLFQHMHMHIHTYKNFCNYNKPGITVYWVMLHTHMIYVYSTLYQKSHNYASKFRFIVINAGLSLKFLSLFLICEGAVNERSTSLSSFLDNCIISIFLHWAKVYIEEKKQFLSVTSWQHIGSLGKEIILFGPKIILILINILHSKANFHSIFVFWG